MVAILSDNHVLTKLLIMKKHLHAIFANPSIVSMLLIMLPAQYIFGQPDCFDSKIGGYEYSLADAKYHLDEAKRLYYEYDMDNRDCYGDNWYLCENIGKQISMAERHVNLTFNYSTVSGQGCWTCNPYTHLVVWAKNVADFSGAMTRKGYRFSHTYTYELIAGWLPPRYCQNSVASNNAKWNLARTIISPKQPRDLSWSNSVGSHTKDCNPTETSLTYSESMHDRNTHILQWKHDYSFIFSDFPPEVQANEVLSVPVRGTGRLQSNSTPSQYHNMGQFYFHGDNGIKVNSNLTNNIFKLYRSNNYRKDETYTITFPGPSTAGAITKISFGLINSPNGCLVEYQYEWY